MRLSLKFVLTFGVIFLIIATVALIGYISYRNGKEAVTEMAEKVMTQTTERAKEQAIQFVKPAGKAAFLIDKMSASNIVQTRESNKMLRFFKDQLRIYKQFSSIYYGDKNGNFYQAKRKPKTNLIEFRIIRREAKKSHKEGDRFTNKVIYYKWTRIDKHGNQWSEDPKQGTENYDPRLRPWYDKALSTRGSTKSSLVWTDVYVFASDQSLGLTISSPVKLQTRKNKAKNKDNPNLKVTSHASFENERIDGVVGVDITVLEISEFLKKLKISKNNLGKAFIINPKGEMVAYPADIIVVTEKKVPKIFTTDDFHNKILKKLEAKNQDFMKSAYPPVKNDHVIKEDITSEEKEKIRDLLISIGFIKDDKKDEYEHRLIKIKEMTTKTPEHGHAAESYKELVKILAKDKEKLKDLTNKFFEFSYDGEKYYAKYSAFPADFPTKWIIGTIVPQSEYLEKIDENNKWTLGIALISIILSTGIAFFLSRKITTPLKKLEKEALRIQKFDLDSTEEIKSNFSEIQAMSQSFTNMKKGLKSFEKFVPSDVVRYLMDSGQEAKIDGHKRELTIYFSDIAGFTSISEAFVPEALVEYLGEYLSEMSTIIDKHEGTLDKYIGDAIMAFWNAPKLVDDQAVKACHAALENRDRLVELREIWRGYGKPPFEARIGLNTGDCIVGNMGSQQRLNYTVIGDAVNLAARLEGINKVYGTEIAISEFTYAKAKDHIEARILDLVAVKGKTEPVKVYELIARKNDIDSDQEKFISNCSEGFQLYLDKSFDSSIKLYKEALEINPNDLTAKNFIIRCENYIATPPDPEWDGVFIMKTK